MKKICIMCSIILAAFAIVLLCRKNKESVTE